MLLSESISKLSPLDKITALFNEVDRLNTRMEQITSEQPIDELLDVFDMHELGKKFAISPQLMRKKLTLAGGKVFKLGKKQVIRKINFLNVLEKLENDLDN